MKPHIPLSTICVGLAIAIGSNIWAVREAGQLGLVIAGLISVCGALTAHAAHQAWRLPSSTQRSFTLFVALIMAVGLFAISYGHSWDNADAAGYEGWEAVILALTPDGMVVLGLTGLTLVKASTSQADTRGEPDHRVVPPAKPEPAPKQKPVKEKLATSTKPKLVDNKPKLSSHLAGLSLEELETLDINAVAVEWGKTPNAVRVATQRKIKDKKKETAA